MRLLAKGRSVTRDHIVDGLIAKRAELAGVIDHLQRQLDQYRADLSHIDGVLRILASDLDPERIKPKRVYARSLLRPQRVVATLPWRAQNCGGRAVGHR